MVKAGAELPSPDPKSYLLSTQLPSGLQRNQIISLKFMTTETFESLGVLPASKDNYKGTASLFKCEESLRKMPMATSTTINLF